MIRIQGLSKRFADGKSALQGVDLSFGEGLLGILGPNGAGKTTLLSILTLGLEPTSGRCFYCELDPARARDRSAIRRSIGYLPQSFSPIGRLTGLEYLVHCACLRGVPLSMAEIRRRAQQALDAVSLAHAAQRRAGTYSGGMKRRLGLAQALIHAPRLLVVDEPTSGLDPEERIRFRNLISEVAEHTAVLLSTHIVEDIEATCPRVAILSSGTLIFDGEPAAILRGSEGRIWEIDESADVAPGAQIILRRIGSGGKTSLVLRSDSAVPNARPVEANLELAYAAYLAARGHSGFEALRAS